MTHSSKVAYLIAALGAGLGTVTALAQVASAQTSTSPVAYVYVSSRPANSSSFEIQAFRAGPDGKLTPVTGSPFPDNVTSMAVNGKYLFAANANGFDIDAYRLHSNGALSYAAATNVEQPGNGSCDNAGPLFLDHSGASLYNIDSNCTNTAYQAFNINKTTGKLAFLNKAGGSPEDNTVLSFIGNNRFAYGSSCYHFSPAIYGFQRNSNGSLTQLNLNPPLPTPPPNAGWCTYLAAADPTNHVAIAMTPMQGFGSQSGPTQLATYTAGSSGALTTASTYSNMPKILAGSVTDLNMAPSGKLLAVAGSSGLQVFHFNGASPITHYTGLLTKDEVDQIFWDGHNHLYGIGQKSGKLYVFTVTASSYSQAPGSPYPIANPGAVIVQPLP